MWRKRKFKQKPVGIFRKTLPAIFLLPVFALLFFFIRGGLFVVKKVEIENRVRCADENQLKDSLQLFGQSFFTLDQKKLTKSLKEKFICIKDINLSRHFPDKVAIQITDRRSAAMLVSMKDQPASPSSLIENIVTPSASDTQLSYIVDDEGVVFSKDTDDPNIPKVFVYNLKLSLGEKLKSNFIADYLRILDKLKTFGVDAHESWVYEDLFVISQNPPGPKIIFNLKENINTQLASLQLILAEAKINLKELEFIDLRFDKPIVRFAPKKNG